MKKIPTLLKRDPDDRSYVTNELNPECAWVLTGEGRATRKFDGTCVKLDDHGLWWARREVKSGKIFPNGFVVEQHDKFTDKYFGWEPIQQSGYYKVMQPVLATQTEPGTYEFCGPKLNRNPEKFEEHVLVRHGSVDIPILNRASNIAYIVRTVERMREWGWEGVVWHHPDGRMAKLKVKDLRDA